MASISVPTESPVMPLSSQTPPTTPKNHRRHNSRSQHAIPLPAFSFNPGASDQPKVQEDGDENKIEVDNMASRRQSRPPPLPEFKFNPGANLPAGRSPSPTHPVLQEMAMNQQRVSRSARPAPLSSFSFPGPGSAQPSPSPTKSSFTDLTNPTRGGTGHRRRSSEFLGGGNEGTPLITASPGKIDSKPLSLPTSHPPRGHAHRRSQAVSISDIETSELIKANALAKARAGSTPTTPSETTQQFNFHRVSPPSRHSPPSTTRSPPASPRRRESAPTGRPRVGFAERVDVIPRPLSLISSETEGSTSTIRYGHSLSSSINSIAASPTPRAPVAVSSPVHIEIETPLTRPKTADPAFLLSSTSSRAEKTLSLISLPKRPLSASGLPGNTSSGSPPSKKKHFWFSHSNNSSPSQTPASEKADPLESQPILSTTESCEKSKLKQGPDHAATVKKRKYHTWTSGIFSRKPGKRTLKTKNKRSPTPPALIRRASDRINEIFDADDTVVLREPSPVAQRSRPRLETSSLPTHTFSYDSRSQITSPVIDLDAALGCSDDDKSTEETPFRSAASRIAKLHSSERRGSFDAFGTVHRRAESAPAMQAVNRSTFGIQRMGSNASLAEDVFDEEEEDNFLAGESAAEVEVDSSDRAPNESDKEVEDSDSTAEANTMTPRPKSADGLGLAIASSPSDDVVIVDAEDDVAQAEEKSSKSTIEAPVFPILEGRKQSIPPSIPFGYPAPQSHYASSTEGRTTSASMVSSPDPEHVTFDNFPRTGRYLGEPSPDFILRASNDDLPSLSDSISSGAVHRISSSANTRSSGEQRVHSVVVQPTSKSQQAWKRASLASLNRLIPGSMNGSKLKFETMPEPTHEEKVKKKANRMSRLMQFWKSKEKMDN